MGKPMNVWDELDWNKLDDILYDLVFELEDWKDILMKVIEQEKKINLSDVIFGDLTAQSSIKETKKILAEFNKHLLALEDKRDGRKEHNRKIRDYQEVKEGAQTTLNLFRKMAES